VGTRTRRLRFTVTSLHVPILAGLLTAGACSPNFHPKGCASDSDCGEGLICAETESTPLCESASGAELHVGMSAPASGISQNLGIGMREGVTLAFDEQNAHGGIHGRTLRLDFRDDGYDPASAEAAVRDLLDVKPLKSDSPRCPTTATPLVAGQQPVSEDALVRGPHAVIALLGNVGTPTMVRTAPIAVETKTLFFGAFTGASLMLRDTHAGPCAKYIFNVRASYAEEARATVEFFLKQGVPDAKHLISFDQNDSFGQAGYDGLVAAYTALRGEITNAPDPKEPIERLRYTRDDETSVPDGVLAAEDYLATLLADGAMHTVGVMMTDTYGPATDFIKGLKDWQYSGGNNAAKRLRLVMSNVSFVGPDSLAQRLKAAGTLHTSAGDESYTNGVYVSQVVPNFETNPGDLVHDYQKALGTDSAQSFTSLEGYLAARVFIAGLLQHDGRYTPDALIPTFERLPDLAFGIGASARFSPDNHQYSKSVWGTEIQPDGTFTDRYFWTEGSALQLSE
jgi:ABC-type branched-subunit amino acid transport system substrate-binding protein